MAKKREGLFGKLLKAMREAQAFPEVPIIVLGMLVPLFLDGKL